MIKKLFILLFSFFFLVTAAGGLLFVTRDWWVKAAFASVVKRLTGFDTTIQGIGLEPRKGVLKIQGLTLLNPYEFNERIFADLPEIYLWLDVPTLARGKGVHLYDLRLNIRELNVEKNEQGVSNISRLSPARKREEIPQSFYLERLVLSIGRVRYHDHSSMVPKKFSINLGIQQETFQRINDPNSIVNLILLKVIKGSPLGPLGLNPASLENRVRGTVNRAFTAGDTLFFGAPSSVSRGTEATEARLEGAVNRVEGKVTKTFQGAKSGGAKVFGRLKSPFGKKPSTATTGSAAESSVPT